MYILISLHDHKKNYFTYRPSGKGFAESAVSVAVKIKMPLIRLPHAQAQTLEIFFQYDSADIPAMIIL